MGGASSETGRDAAWEHFCQTYWYPVYAFIRRKGEPADNAGDLTQAFFAKLIQQDWLARVERRESRFSTLLVTVLKNFLIKQHWRETTLKRGGGETPIPLDLVQAENWYGAEPASTETPEILFEKRWALAVMDAAFERLKEENFATGKGRLFDALNPFLSREAVAGDYDAAGAKLGLSPRSVAVAVHRLRADYRAMVREEVAAGLSNKQLVEEEMRALGTVLAR